MRAVVYKKPNIVSVGHENRGIVEEVGPAVAGIREGDRVVMPFNIACGSCFNCGRGFTNACLVVNPDGVSGGYGYAGMGPYPGGQAEYLRVPFADFNSLNAKRGQFQLPLGAIFEKGLTIGTGQTPVKRYNADQRSDGYTKVVLKPEANAPA